MTNPKLLTLAEVESLWASLDKRDVVISSIEFRAILETCRMALAENKRMREALEQAADDLCSEFCGTSHHEVCIRAKSALGGER